MDLELTNCPNCGDNEWAVDETQCQRDGHKCCNSCGLCKNCIEQYFANACQEC